MKTTKSKSGNPDRVGRVNAHSRGEQVRLTDRYADRLRAIADQKRMKRTAVIECALDLYAAREKIDLEKIGK